MINLHKLNVSDYNKLLAKLLGTFEADSSTPYFDSKTPNKHVTIGRGFDIEPTNSLAQQKVFATLGLNQTTGLTPAANAAEKAYVAQIIGVLTGSDTTNASLQASLNQIMANRAVDPLFAGIAAINSQTTFTLTTAQIESTYTAIIEDKEKVIDRVIADRSTLPLSFERAVLVAMAYQGLTTNRSAALKAAIVADSNRAEAWYLIRYEGYLGANDGPGQAKRHFVEAQAFGLYDNPTAVTTGEAKQVFEMLTKHRPRILAYEAQYGVPPDGTDAVRNMIAVANADVNLSSITKAQTLFDALIPARDAFIKWLNSQLPTEQQLNASILNPAALYYNGNAGVVGRLDATGDDGKGTGMEHNVLVGNTGADTIIAGAGDDYLFGMQGNDTLQGGAGSDTYVINAGEGHDTILDSDGDGKLVVAGSALKGAKKADYKTLDNGQSQWSVDGGAILYTLDYNSKTLTISGSTLGAGNDVSIKLSQDDIAKLTGSQGYLGLTLEKGSPVALSDQPGANPFGQTQVSFALVQEGQVTADQSGSGNSNSYALNPHVLNRKSATCSAARFNRRRQRMGLRTKGVCHA
ncbi:hypothetical protein KIK84_00955 [Curvibacter sp. CHRR-16]|uniref:calcium-binding protein n=1 Tax=Curvibacter sp. CHRR-16 TaxID=2835872 RepID=UPI001BDA5040|nr:calcium-binding protein [Curvibacter sp. CHRR-16]MBT0568881.1 hypothetical protein [Curvibacter sp. CHRR-16]